LRVEVLSKNLICIIQKVDALTGMSTNCTSEENIYRGQNIDLGVEITGVLLHILAIILALRKWFV
jgi:hypothetical protein